MQLVKIVPVFALLLIALCACEEQPISIQEPKAKGAREATPLALDDEKDLTNGPGGQPYPTITKQTFIPEDSKHAFLKTLTWRIEWPIYPASTDPNKIPTVYTLSNGALTSFDFLNSRPASTTYKTNFNLYHNAKIEMSKTLWTELTHTVGSGDQMEAVWFNQVQLKNPVNLLMEAATERPILFESYWESDSDELPVYQQGDLFFFKLWNQHRYGAIRIVSMTPRIIEVYLAVPNK
ncbi:hypothetical protein DYU11_23850 [Fibrisoma montanum]|uniref:Lipoprotein n=1 Tax=Fibrisoma montanum TaxID=2305895 RepID=A0A418M2J0_9BACT|nr:hypothetical protein [Fibrisoma montanum]RIV19953.1 hypothetical protein DYU11_23850 [Fibrisoma montanum]